MKNARTVVFPAILVLALVGFGVAQAAPRITAPQASGTSFHFVFSADSRDNYTVLPAFSHKMVSLSPVFGVFGGDLCGTFSTTCINNTWKPAMAGNNNDGITRKTFVLRGNHDSGSLSAWQGLWDFQGMATRVGATNYRALTPDATYSFDYGNSHFAILDNPGGGPSTLTSTEISWLDKDLTAAESRGKVHLFLFTHGPMYGATTQHGSDYPSTAMKAVLNKHRISASFAGHEHITQYTHITTSVESGINYLEEFTMGRAGAPAYSVAKFTTWHADVNAFADIAVNGSQFTVTIYSQSGAKLYSKTFSDTVNTKVVYRSAGPYDGQILASTAGSAVGNFYNATNATMRIGDDAVNRQYRAILSFNTAALPDDATIQSVTLAVRNLATTWSTGSPFSSLGNVAVDVMDGSFSDNVMLEAQDFQAADSKAAAFTITNNLLNGWYSAAMSPADFGYINKTGITQFRLRFANPTDNNGAANYITLATGDNSIAAYRPRLVIVYSVP